MASIDILGKNVPIEFEVGDGAVPGDLDRPRLSASAETMAELINRTDWPSTYRDAFRSMNQIIFFAGQVMVNGYRMDRPCCDQDDAIFYWEAEEFLKNMDDDVHANTFFHDCWHVVQYKAHGNQYAYTLVDQVEREVDAITHQIGVAHTLGCSPSEIKFLEDFRGDQRLIIARLEDGVNRLVPHLPGAMARDA